MTQNDSNLWSRGRLGLLIGIHIIVCCASLIRLADANSLNVVDPAKFHIFFDPSRWYVAAAVVAAFAIVAPLFAIARFSFGYFVGFYFYTMALGYLWLNCFTDLNYDHWKAGLSLALAAVAFLLPALFVTAPIRQLFVLSAVAFDRLLISILFLGVVTIIAGATYSLQFTGIEQVYDFRDKLEFPGVVRYLLWSTSSALLPFAFAGFVARRAHFCALATLLLLVFFYPIVLNKTTLFAPFWLLAILLATKLVESRIAAVLSLLVPLLAGLLLVDLVSAKATVLLFSFVNFRMVALPSVALDVYNDFFSKHELTYFCQISVLKQLLNCPYREHLSVVLKDAYDLGNFNGSLFATEGIASVGIAFAPTTVLACGFIIALGNRVSAGLPSEFILVSGAILPQMLLNVPLTTALLTHGTMLLFLLWYITPRTIFGQRLTEAADSGPVLSESTARQ